MRDALFDPSLGHFDPSLFLPMVREKTACLFNISLKAYIIFKFKPVTGIFI